MNAYMEGLRIATRTRGVTVTTVCPGFVSTAMTPMDSATPFIMTAEAAAARIARLIARRKGGVVCFPLPMALLTSLDRAAAGCDCGAVDRAEPEPRATRPEHPSRCGETRPMIDLALKMLLDEKARFAATVLGVGFAAGTGAGSGRLVLRAARKRQHHDR